LGRLRSSPPQLIWEPDPPSSLIGGTSNERAGSSSDAVEPSQKATRPPWSTGILVDDGARTGENSAFAKKLAADQPNLSAELEVLQKDICRDCRGSLFKLPMWKLVPLTIVGLLVLSAAASGAY
jgi:hypothetical protein